MMDVEALEVALSCRQNFLHHRDHAARKPFVWYDALTMLSGFRTNAPQIKILASPVRIVYLVFREGPSWSLLSLCLNTTAYLP